MPKKNQPDWSQFTLSIPIASSPNRVFSAWTKSKELSNWFLARAEMDLRRGGSYSWWWQTGTPDTGKILYARKPSRLSFSFDQGSICEIFIQKKGKGSLVTLRQHHIPVTEQAKYRVHLGCKAGWTFYLTNLKAYLEHRIDLRETRPQLLKIKGLLNQGQMNPRPACSNCSVSESVDKRQLLKFAVLNCELKGENLYPVYRKPFDVLSNGHEPVKWRRGWDSKAPVSATP